MLNVNTLTSMLFLRWLGFLLMNVGEMGNFISYAFAPASIVAPLGTVSTFALYLGHFCIYDRYAQFALIANCVFAPFMLKERFRTVSSKKRS